MATTALGWVDRISTWLAAVAAACTGLMALHIVADALGRTMFRQPLPATLELTQYGWMPALAALALGYAMLLGEHIKVDLLTGGASPQVRRVVQTVAMFVTLATVALLAWAAVESAIASVELAEHSAGAAWVPVWPGRIALGVGMIGLTLQTGAELVRAFRGEQATDSEEQQMLAAAESLGAPPLDEVTVGSDDEQSAKTKGALR